MSRQVGLIFEKADTTGADIVQTSKKKSTAAPKEKDGKK